METQTPPDINFFTTYRCNSRCRNCGIWQGKLQPPSHEKMDTAILERLMNDPIFIRCSGVGLAGGEPTIAPLTWQLLDILPPDKHVTITTNALNSDKLVDSLRSRNNRDRFTVQLSLDGIGAVNDEVRGIEGAYLKTLKLLLDLEELGIRRLISFTVNRLNTDQLLACYDLAEKHGALFSTRLAYSGGAYSNEDNQAMYQIDHEHLSAIDRQLETILTREIKKPNHSPAQLVFWRKMTEYARGNQRDLPCQALHSGMVIDLYGNVFPNCPVMMRPIGNLHQTRLSEIWQSPEAEKARETIRQLACGGCWNDCQVVTNIAMEEDFLEREYTILKSATVRLEGGILPREIDFNSGNDKLLLNGWFSLEGQDEFHFRWTGPRFSLIVPNTSSTVRFFAMFPELPNNLETRKIEISVGDDSCGNLITNGVGEWREYSFTLPRPAKKGEIVRFHLNNFFCPAESGQGPDFRRLGAAIRTLAFLS
ncbi:MAG: radical SAM protein [Proteobacteria bacterium]|nr:radical SAM protein [Pseudomonadota bacterium]MBU1686230.1 radical SAM protein [Pseudomonadota bacterium]